LYNWRKIYELKAANWGLWRYSRHPIYFSEVLFWLGLWVTTIGVKVVLWWLVLMPALLWTVIYFIAIPLTEDYLVGKFSEYGYYQKEVSKFVFWKPAYMPINLTP